MTGYPAPQNLLLRTAERARRPHLLERLKLVQFEPGHQFWGPNEVIREALFPVRGVVSIMALANPGRFVEVGMSGNEGLIGLPLFLGGNQSSTAAVAQTAGEAYVLDAESFHELLGSRLFADGVQRYTQCFLTMLAQMAACHQTHVIEKQCARWLLMVQDRLRGNSFPVTQDFFSKTLGVRRASVNRAASHLQKLGLIRYERGLLTIPERAELERYCCPCYGIIRREFDSYATSQGLATWNGA